MIMSERNPASPDRNRAVDLLAWLAVLVWVGLIYWLSSQPDSSLKELGLSGDLLAIAGHLSLFGILTLLLVLALRRTTSLAHHTVSRLALLLVMLFALSDELHQRSVPGRSSSLSDWLVDVAAALLVLLLIRWWIRRRDS
jgi:VanZ family protein